MQLEIKDNIILKTSKAGKTTVAISRAKRKILKHVWLVRLFMAILGIALIGILICALIKLTNIRFEGSLKLARNFILAPKDEVKNLGGATNILVLGRSGAGFDSPDLTDTILLISIPWDRSKVSVLALPRDIWIPEIRAKLNSAYYWGNQKKQDGGIILAKSTIEQITGLSIQYAAVFDFNGFKKMIDTIGGIEVDVKKSFTDNKYPVAGRENDLCGGDPELACRYETVTFNQGLVSMDGETALKYVRSRHSEDLSEGTDLARSARQEQVIAAIKAKLLDIHTIFSPNKLTAFYSAVRSSVITDLSDEEIAILARKVFDSRNNIQSYVLPEELLVNPPKSEKYDNLYVFVSKSGDWGEVKEWIQKKLQ